MTGADASFAPRRPRPKSMLVVADLDNPAAEPFAVIAVHPELREGTGCKATVVSLHWTRANAEAEVERSGNA